MSLLMDKLKENGTIKENKNGEIVSNITKTTNRKELQSNVLPTARKTFLKNPNTAKRQEVNYKDFMIKTLPTVADYIMRKKIGNDATNIIENTGIGAYNGVLHFAKQINDVASTTHEREKSLFDKTNEKFGVPNVTSKYQQRIVNNLSSANKNLSNSIRKNEELIKRNVENASNPVTQKLTELAPSIGQMLPGFMPGVGSAYFAGSAASQYTDEGLERGMTKDEARTYGGVMGLLEGGTETLGAWLTKGVGKAIGKGNLSKALKTYGLDIAENTVEEAIIEPISETTALLVGGKDKADFSNMSARMLQAGIDGGLVSAIMGGASLGIGSAINVANKINSQQSITKNEMKTAIEDIKASKRIDIEQEVIGGIRDAITGNDVTNRSSILQSEQLPVNNEKNRVIKKNTAKIDESVTNILASNEMPADNKVEKAPTANLAPSELIRAINQRTNNNIELDVEKLPRAKAKLEGNKITLDYEKGGLEEIIHETTHYSESNSKGYEVLSNHVLTELEKSGELKNIKDELRQRYEEQYAKENREFTEKDLEKEVVAKYTERFINDEIFINRIVNADKGTAQRIYEWIKNKINYYKKVAKMEPEQRLEYENLRKAEKMWEKALKDVENNKAPIASDKQAPQYSIAGRKALENIKSDSNMYNKAVAVYNQAQNMAKDGKSNIEIFRKTGWFKDDAGKMKFSFSDKDMNLKKKYFKENFEYDLEDILEHDTLFMFYPELRKYTVEFQDINKGRRKEDGRINGSFDSTKKKIRLDIFKAGLKENTEGTLIHEIQHAIQNIEGFTRGTSRKLGKKQYRKSLGEREARDTAERFVKEKYENKDLSSILPESAKFNRNILEKMKDGLYNYLNTFNRGGNNEEIEEISQKASKRDKSLVVDGVKKKTNTALTTKDKRAPRYSLNEELENSSSFSMEKIKEKQLEIIKKYNPVYDDYHTWIRNIEDIKTFEESLQDSDFQGYDEFTPDYTLEMAQEAIRSGKITVYSSYPINQGIFVSPSYMEAESYSGNGKVYEKTVKLTDVAWIDPTQGQYAKVQDVKYSLDNVDNRGRKITKDRYGNQTLVDGGRRIINQELDNTSSFSTSDSDIRYSLDDEKTTDVEEEKIAEVLTEVERERDNGKLTSWIYQNFVDDLHTIDKIGKETKNDLIYKLANNARQSRASADFMIGESATNIKGQKTGKSLQEIFKDYDKKEAFTYLLHKHNIDRMNLENRALEKLQLFEAENQDFVIKKGIYKESAMKASDKKAPKAEPTTLNEADLKYIIANSDVDSKESILARQYLTLLEEYKKVKNKPVFGYTVTSDHSETQVGKMERLNPKLKNLSKDINNYVNNQLNIMLDTGMISKEQKDIMQDMYKNYVPTYRVMTGTSGMKAVGNTAVVSSTIKKATGSNRDIAPIDVSMATQTVRILNAGKRNMLLNAIYDETVKNPEKMSKYVALEEIEQDTVSNIFEDVSNENEMLKKGDSTKPNIVTFYRNGNKVKMQVDNMLFDSLKSLTSDNVVTKARNSNVGKIASAPIKVFKGLVTGYNPLFVPVNFIRDSQDAIFYSKTTRKYLQKYPEAVKEIVSNSEKWQQYLALGGLQTSFFDYETGIKENKQNVVNVVLDKIEGVNNFIEALPRFQTFLATVKDFNDYNELMKGMYESADITVNFGRSGKVTKIVDTFVAPYLNPAVQGLDKNIRSIRETINRHDAASSFKNISKLLIKSVILGVAARVINDLAHCDDEDYEELEDNIKDINYILWKNEDGTFAKIPKGRVLSAIGSITNRFYDENTDLSTLPSTLLTQLAPQNPLETNFITPLIQASKENGQTWYGEDIVSDALKDKLPKDQYDEKTTSLAKWIGEITNWSPKRIDYVMKQYSGGVGQFLMPLMTPKAETNPFVAKFTADPVLNNKNVGKFYDEIDRVTQINNSDAVTDETLLTEKYLNSIRMDLSGLYNQKRTIENSTLSDKNKKEQSRSIQRNINKITENALQEIQDVKIKNRSAIIGDYEYYKNADNEWTKLTNEEKVKNKNISIETYSIYKNAQYGLKDKLVKSKEMEEDDQLSKTQKIELLLKGNYTDKEKREIYNNYLLYSDEKLYTYMKKVGISNINEYLKYKANIGNVEGEKDESGKTISGSKKKAVQNYISSLNISSGEKLLLYASTGNYALTYSEKTNLFNYIKSIKGMTSKEKQELVDSLKCFQ